MAKRIDLRAYQESIASRLAAAQAGGGVPALLGFAAGAQRWLIDLPAAGEVLPLPALTTVPLTQSWFAGLANVHGELQSVVDFSAFCGGPPTPRDSAARILRVGTRHGINAALLVTRVHGLKRSDTLFAADADEMPGAAWQGESFTDTQGLRWTRLELEQLLADPRFLDAALPEIT
jgi:twitching motility protein PilI